MLEHRASGPEAYSNYTRKDILKFGSPIGCVEPGAEGLQYGHTDSGIINVAGAALMAVTNGGHAQGVGQHVRRQAPHLRERRPGQLCNL